MKKFLMFLFIFLYTGCASMHSQAGAVPNALIYEHRIPQNEKITQVVTDEKGLVKQIIPWAEITTNSAKVGNSIANVVQAFKGNFGFPFGMIPDIVSTSLEQGQKYQKETADQEVEKVYWVEGMTSLEVETPSKLIIKVNKLDTTESSSKSNSKVEVKKDAEKSSV